MSSSTTTYIIAPAANDSSPGMTGAIQTANSTAINANSGSTIPDKHPNKNALAVDTPSCRKGSEIAAPSGKFCMPIPIAKAIADAYIAGLSCWAANANESPTAAPSGILCNVTAKIRSVVRFEVDAGPSRTFSKGCKCGMIWSNPNRNNAPSANPHVGIIHPGSTPAPASSIAGISKLHIEAAIITPAANPRKICWNFPGVDL